MLFLLVSITITQDTGKKRIYIIVLIQHEYYFFHDKINIKNLDLNKIKTDEKSYKNIVFYHTGYVMAKNLSGVKINSINPLYLIIDK